MRRWGASWGALLFLLTLPGAAAALMLPGRLPLWRAVLAMPTIALPALLALIGRQRGQRRAAFGLGAGPLDRLVWIWLPQLTPGMLGSLLLLGLFMLAEHWRP